MEKALTSKDGSDSGVDGCITGGDNSLCKGPVAGESKIAEKRQLVT